MKRLVFAALISAIASFSSAAGAVSLDGALLRFDFFGASDAADPLGTITATVAGTQQDVVVGPGVEYTILPAQHFADIDISGNELKVTIVGDTQLQPGFVFAGISITDLNDTIRDFNIFQVVSNTINNVGLTLDEDNLFLNFANTGPVTTGQQLVATISVVPLPATLPLLLSGFVGLWFYGWRRRKAAA